MARFVALFILIASFGGAAGCGAVNGEVQSGALVPDVLHYAAIGDPRGWLNYQPRDVSGRFVEEDLLCDRWGGQCHWAVPPSIGPGEKNFRLRWVHGSSCANPADARVLGQVVGIAVGSAITYIAVNRPYECRVTCTPYGPNPLSAGPDGETICEATYTAY